MQVCIQILLTVYFEGRKIFAAFDKKQRECIIGKLYSVYWVQLIEMFRVIFWYEGKLVTLVMWNESTSGREQRQRWELDGRPEGHPFIDTFPHYRIRRGPETGFINNTNGTSDIQSSYFLECTGIIIQYTVSVLGSDKTITLCVYVCMYVCMCVCVFKSSEQNPNNH